MNNLATHLKPKESFPHATLRQADSSLIYVTEEQHLKAEKFSRDIEYANTYFDGYEKHFTLWSPVVKGKG